MPKVQIQIDASGNAESKMKGITGSFLKATLAVDVLKGAFNLVKNVIGDAVKNSELMKAQLDGLKKTVGGVVNVVGKELVQSFLDSASGITEFINKAENLATIGAALKVSFDFIIEIVKSLVENVKNAISPITDLFTKVEGGSKGFNMLGAALTTVNIALKLTGDFLKLVIQAFVDMGIIVVNAGKLVGEFFDLLTGKAKWSDVKAGFDDFIKSYANGFKNLKDNSGTLITDAIKSLKEFNKSAEENAKKAADSYNQSYGNILTSQQTNNSKSVADNEKKNKELENSDKKSAQTRKATWQDYYNSLQSIGSQALGVIQSALDTFYNNQYNTIQKASDQQLSEIDRRTQKEIEMLGVAEETKTEQLQNEIMKLNESLAMTKSAKEQSSIEEQIIEKEKELARTKILEDGERQKEKVRKNALKKEREEKIKQFNSNKALQIANIWVSTAAGIVGAWGMGISQLGPIAGSIVAGIATAALLAVAGAQTGVIAAQTPAFETGGVIGGSSLTGDRVMIRANSKERVLTPEQNDAFEELAYNRSGNMGSGFVNQGTIIVQANDPDEFRKKLIEVRRFELVR